MLINKFPENFVCSLSPMSNFILESLAVDGQGITNFATGSLIQRISR